MPTFPCAFLDVFTDVPLEGNGLAVVHDADRLDDETMLRFARETRLSDTAFVQAASAPGADYRNRIFMASGEIPFAGHPSLGAAVAVARRRGLRAARLVQETGAGRQPIDVQLIGDRAVASMLQEPAELGPQVDAALALAAVGLAPADAAPELPPQAVSTGLAHLLVPVAGVDALARAAPDHEAIDALLAPLGATCLYLAWIDPSGGPVRARSFLRSAAEGGEDPATGSAAGPLCAYLAARRGHDRLEIVQGVEMGRPSRLEAAVEGERVRVGGAVVAVIDGTLRL